jgi:GTP-binding protein
MDISSAEFVSSVTSLSKCPDPDKPEYAFIGRSNVGKSSLINMLTGRKGLAKTSSSPGKTQTINHFIINKESEPWYIVDLPGYGYAKVSKTMREKWEEFIRNYLLKRQSLMCVFVLIDARHEALKPDLDFMRWLGEKGVPFAMLFTKCDKMSNAALDKNFKNYTAKMMEDWESLPPFFFSSSETGRGKEELLHFIAETNAVY